MPTPRSDQSPPQAPAPLVDAPTVRGVRGGRVSLLDTLAAEYPEVPATSLAQALDQAAHAAAALRNDLASSTAGTAKPADPALVLTLGRDRLDALRAGTWGRRQVR